MKSTEPRCMVPNTTKRRHTNINKKTGVDDGLKFSRPAFVQDILFSEEGFNLEPRVFTKSTKNLPNVEDRVPSTSAKDHLPYFAEIPFVASYMDFTRLQKLRGTYVGTPHVPEWHEVLQGEDGTLVQRRHPEEPATGFWKYIDNGKIHPSFLLHRTVTGRTASASPNAQNFPKRGKGNMKEVVKAFRRVFRAPPGYKLLEADLSQAELRVAAWMANEHTMIDLYRNGADVHAATAARTMGLTIEQFNALDEETRAFKRFQAKAIRRETSHVH